MVAKNGNLEEASVTFADSGVNITPTGRPYLGAAIGSQELTIEYVRSKVSKWSFKVALLGDIAKSQQHTAFVALTHRLLSKWTYFSHVIPNIRNELPPLDEGLRSDLLPALTGRPLPGDIKYALFVLATCMTIEGLRI